MKFENMPKGLSLKKNPQETIKNQKITHFFKNSNVIGTQKLASPTREHSLIKTTLGTNVCKRKAISPLKTILECGVSEVNDKENSSLKKKLKGRTNDNKPVKESDFLIKNTSCDDKETAENNSKVIVNLQQLQSTVSEDLPKLGTSFEDKDIYREINSNGNKCNSNNPKKLGKNFVLDIDTGLHKKSINEISGKFCNDSPANHFQNYDQNSRKIEDSLTKSSSTLKPLQSCENEINHIFEEDWEMENLNEVLKDLEDLDLTIIQRCEVISVVSLGQRLELRLRRDNLSCTCFIEGIWICLNLQKGDIVSVLAARNSSGQYQINNTSGLIVFRPDYLLSSTSVVAGVFCQRKAVLQERWRGIDSANIAMTIGILVHELVQKAFTEGIINSEDLHIEMDKIIKGSIQMLYDAGLCEDEARSNMLTYIVPLSEFMRKYIAKMPHKDVKMQNNDWSGHIDKVLDIEENLCCPKLGLKGKIDATLEVTIHEHKGKRCGIVPLELKSGKASVSVEHRGQLVLYGMMLSLLRDEDPTTSLQRGLLLYLKEHVELREVSCGYPERRDLIMLRNQLVQYLSSTSGKTGDDSDVDEKFQTLPEPIHRENVCAKCPYLTICSLHLWHTDGPKVSGSHPLSKLREQALGHLSIKHIEYFLHWAHLLKLEEKVQLMTSPLHTLWTDSVEQRMKRGTCAGNLTLETVQVSIHRYFHIFKRQCTVNRDFNVSKTTGPQEGDFSIVSIDNRPWLAAGVITLTNDKNIQILLERDLSVRQSKDTVYHIDAYESYASTVQNLTNLGVLIEESDRAYRLRRIIIDKELPTFVEKMPRDIHRLGAKLMRSLNIEQQRAVIKALASKDYMLLQGLPGTGKTQTISILIQMLIALKQRVLVTAHTHSAVDTVLCRLPESLKVMRLGSSARVAASLLHRSEENLTATCDNSEQLAELYDSMEVVGVTCLGAAHAMLTRTSFDVCIVDEATQVLQCTVLRPLFAAKRFVLVGDPEQLPPVVRRNVARQLGMEESLFHRLMSKEATSTLRLQYRMNQPLADLANLISYSNRLKCANQTVAEASLDIDVQKISSPSNESWILTTCSPEHKFAAIFINLETVALKVENKKTICNLEEACIVSTIVEAMIKAGVQNSDIGVIAPYRDQVSLLRRTLAHVHVEASTVDQFQGRDKSAIIYSCTKKEDGQRDKIVKEEEILNDQRRLAVSVTRAKHKLIVIGNSKALRRYEPLQRLIDACYQISLREDMINSLVTKYKNFCIE